MLTYEQITVKKDGKNILSIPRLTLHTGMCYAIVGPSGAGKSTFLKVTNGLQLPTSGRLTFCEEEVTTKKISLSLQRSMVYVAQHPIMFDKTVEENIGIGLKLRKEPPSLIASKVKKMLELIGLQGYEKKRAINLSGGEAQRVALARAFILQPALLLLDEPTANLDPKNMLMMEEMIRTIRKETKTTILIVTHNLAQAKRISDEVLFVYEGGVMERGGAEEFFRNPKSEELRAFISVEVL